jgi:hypothetical protein
MAYTIKYDAVFKRDYRRVMGWHPEPEKEFRSAVSELAAHGRLPESYHPHPSPAPVATTTATSTSTCLPAGSMSSCSTCPIERTP